MGLELSEEAITQNMPEYVLATRPNVNEKYQHYIMMRINENKSSFYTYTNNSCYRFILITINDFIKEKFESVIH